MQLVEAGPEGHRYKTLASASDRAAVATCLAGLSVLEAPSSPPTGLYVLARGVLGQPLFDPGLVSGHGVAVQVPELGGTGIDVSGPDLICVPPGTLPGNFAVSVALLVTDSLNEARAMLTTPQSFVLFEPAGGWVETGKPVTASSISWGKLAFAGAVLAAAGYLVFR